MSVKATLYYFRLAFRNLVRRYDCDLAFTPMIIANSFVHSAKARDSELTTNKGRGRGAELRGCDTKIKNFMIMASFWSTSWLTASYNWLMNCTDPIQGTSCLWAL